MTIRLQLSRRISKVILSQFKTKVFATNTKNADSTQIHVNVLFTIRIHSIFFHIVMHANFQNALLPFTEACKDFFCKLQ